jgi:hypothetical protein
MEILGDVGHVNLVSARLEKVLVLSKISARFVPNVPLAQ